MATSRRGHRQGFGGGGLVATQRRHGGQAQAWECASFRGWCLLWGRSEEAGTVFTRRIGGRCLRCRPAMRGTRTTSAFRHRARIDAPTKPTRPRRHRRGLGHHALARTLRTTPSPTCKPSSAPADSLTTNRPATSPKPGAPSANRPPLSKRPWNYASPPTSTNPSPPSTAPGSAKTCSCPSSCAPSAATPTASNSNSGASPATTTTPHER
jgi:hypothetical protein